MDAKQSELYRRFRVATKRHVKYRKEGSPDVAREDWVVRCHDDPDAFVREVELLFPSWEAFRHWLEEVKQKEKQWRSETKALYQEYDLRGLSPGDMEFLKRLPDPEAENRGNDGKGGFERE
jgi:hypothetical protein